MIIECGVWRQALWLGLVIQHLSDGFVKGFISRLFFMFIGFCKAFLIYTHKWTITSLLKYAAKQKNW